jgi:hypothetical protein
LIDIIAHAENQESFIRRLRYVVFDEIHTISTEGGAGGSEELEKLINMIPCPIIGLSATLANADMFCGWIEQAKKLQRSHALQERGELEAAQAALRDRTINAVDMIIHSERSTALNYYGLKLIDQTKRREITLAGEERRFQLGPIRRLIAELPTTATAPGDNWTFAVDWTIQLDGSAEELKQMATITGLPAGIKEEDDFEDTQPLLQLDAAFRPYSAAVVITVNQGDPQRYELPALVHSGQIGHIVLRFTFNGRVQHNGQWMFDLAITADEALVAQWPYSIEVEDNLGHIEFGKLSEPGVFNLTLSDETIQAFRSIAVEDIGARPTSIRYKPLCMLTQIDHTSEQDVDGFLAAVPTMHGIDVAGVFQGLADHLKRLPLDETSECVPSVESIVASASYLRLITEYNRQVIDISAKLLASDGADAVAGATSTTPSLAGVAGGDPHQYAHFRASYTALLKSLKQIILSEPSLIIRVALDAIVCYRFHKAGLDWYGEQWLFTASRLPSSVDEDWDQDMRTTIDLLTRHGNGFSLLVTKATASFFCFTKRHTDVYLRTGM